jgi:hypothetical protein
MGIKDAIGTVNHLWELFANDELEICLCYGKDIGCVGSSEGE